MKRDKDTAPNSTGLRKLAEERLKKKGLHNSIPGTIEDTQRLLHELQVHQIELELQNEALRQTRDEVEAGLAKYSDLYDFSPVAYFTFDCNAAILQVNLTGASLLGLERSRLLKRRFDSFIAEENRPAFSAFLERVIVSHDKQTCEISLHKDGQPLYVRIDAVAAIPGEECRAVVEDITENKRMRDLVEMRMHLMEYASGHTLEEVLRETLDKVETLVGSPIGFYQFISSDQKSITLHTWSTGTLKEFRTAQGQGPHYPMMEGGVWADCIRLKKPVIHNDYASLPNKKGMPEGHAKLIRELVVPVMRGGKIVAILGVGNKAEDYSEKDAKIVSFMADVAWTMAERTQSEEALKISETRYRRLFEASQDGILILNAETGQISDVNPFLVEILGYPHEELLGKKLWEIGAFKDIKASKAAFRELQATGYGRYEDLPIETKDGKTISVEFVCNVYLMNHHKVIQCNIRDITDRKLAAEALQKAHDELERRVEERTVELRTALFEIKTMKDQLEAENIYFRQELKMRHQFGHILGQSDGLRYVLYRVEQVAPTNTTILILGETGTGKDLIAAAIHNLSPRKERPLITVNCAALPGNLIESELFGREKGAFTGADTRQVGRFEIANGSTLCLDEIGELPLELQAKLLRVVQHGEFERLGSSHTIKVDVRIVATTNRDLEEEVRKGRFRQDLYYRLNVFPITVPPLRQRTEDIPVLVRAFVERYSKKLGKQITSIQKESIKALQDYPWPGNIRELESIVERALILCPGPVFQLTDKLEHSSLSSSSMMTLEEMERNQILKTLTKSLWRINGRDGAAAILGLHPSTLRARMHKLGILRPEAKASD